VRIDLIAKKMRDIFLRLFQYLTLLFVHRRIIAL
jgi:hypothetical protein